MERIYLICGAIGGTFWVGQFVLSLLGGGDHHGFSGDDADHGSGGDGHGHGDHDVTHEGAITWLVGMLTLRTITAGITFFGLGGLAATYANYSKPLAGQIAVGSALLAIFIVASVMKLLGKLRDEGTVRIDGAVGKVATVYLTIPGQNLGKGKITLKIQERLMEYQAVSTAGELATGTQVVVVAVVGSDTLEVMPARM